MTNAEILFSIGRLTATRGVADLMSCNVNFYLHVQESLERYIHGDWGDVCASDAEQNDESVLLGERILAAYKYPGKPEWRIWIITEWDRSATTILFPHEY